MKPVVALDIDGTLGDWHEHFRKFLENWTGKKCPPDHRMFTTRDGQVLERPRWDGSEPFYKWLGVSKATYRQAKLAFRQGGLKRFMPCYPSVAEHVKALRRVSEVWLCTTRPYLRLDNIDPDTRHWLRRNRIQYDGVIFGEHKYRDLVKIVGRDRIAGVLDDDPQLAKQALSLGLPTLLRGQPWNNVPIAPRVQLDLAFQMLHELVEEKRHAGRA